MPLKTWNGSKWTRTFPSTWNGSKWIKGAMFVWNGSKWVPDRPEPVTVRYTDTWDATWSETFSGDNTVNAYNSSTGQMYQGRYGHHDTIGGIWHNPILYGMQRSMFGFNHRDVQTKLQGATIEKVEVYLYMDHSWYVAQGKASLVTHASTSKPIRFSQNGKVGEYNYPGRKRGMWINVGAQYGRSLASGTVTGFGLYKDSQDPLYYSYWNGAGQSNNPKLRITYTKTTNPEEAPKPNVPTSFNYTVASGDTLWGIANKYDITIANLYDWNNLSSSTILVGQKLKIYTSANPPSIVSSKPLYTAVRSGEGLVQVTERLMIQGLLPNNFNTAISILRSLNGFGPNPILQPNQLVMYDKGK